MRGSLWGFVFNLGALTKVTFGFFLVRGCRGNGHPPEALRIALVAGDGGRNSDLSHAVSFSSGRCSGAISSSMLSMLRSAE